MEKFKIATPEEWVEVDGKLVEYPGFEQFTFFLHQEHTNPNRWVVSEKSTGFAVGIFEKVCKVTVLQETGKVLYTKGPDAIKRGMRRGSLDAIKRIGPMPD